LEVKLSENTVSCGALQTALPESVLIKVLRSEHILLLKGLPTACLRVVKKKTGS